MSAASGVNLCGLQATGNSSKLSRFLGNLLLKVTFQLQTDLFDDLQGLPRNSTVRKMNDLIKRARTARVRNKTCFELFQVHAVLVSYLKKQMPTFGKDGINS